MNFPVVGLVRSFPVAHITANSPVVRFAFTAANCKDNRDPLVEESALYTTSLDGDHLISNRTIGLVIREMTRVLHAQRG